MCLNETEVSLIIIGTPIFLNFSMRKQTSAYYLVTDENGGIIALSILRRREFYLESKLLECVVFVVEEKYITTTAYNF